MLTLARMWLFEFWNSLMKDELSWKIESIVQFGIGFVGSFVGWEGDLTLDPGVMVPRDVQWWEHVQVHQISFHQSSQAAQQQQIRSALHCENCETSCPGDGVGLFHWGKGKRRALFPAQRPGDERGQIQAGAGGAPAALHGNARGHPLPPRWGPVPQDQEDHFPAGELRLWSHWLAWEQSRSKPNRELLELSISIIKVEKITTNLFPANTRVSSKARN